MNGTDAINVKSTLALKILAISKPQKKYTGPQGLGVIIRFDIKIDNTARKTEKRKLIATTFLLLRGEILTLFCLFVIVTTLYKYSAGTAIKYVPSLNKCCASQTLSNPPKRLKTPCSPPQLFATLKSAEAAGLDPYRISTGF